MATSEQFDNTGQPPEELTVEQAIRLTAGCANANLQHEELGRRYYAAWWLGRFKVSEPAAVDALIAALEDDSDRTEDGGYPLRRNAARALGKLGDQRAVEPLIQCLESDDVYVREAAAQSLEMLNDPRSIQPLLKLLEGGVEAATTVPGKPHLVQPYTSILEALGTIGATEAIGEIEPFTQHRVRRVQFSALRAMYQLTQNEIYGQRLIEALQENELQLRRSVLMDLGAIGYLPAAKAVSETLAENSLKLISLKGILEHHLNHVDSNPISPEAVEVMNLMDSLL
ncbi:MAG: HEAT repeat domain-containing protein [Microcoleaceae cyanobacterium]